MATADLEWNDLSVLLAVCRTGSLSGAARLLGHNHSTVFRRVNAIEERTGVRFFERLPQGYRMTEAGEAAWLRPSASRARCRRSAARSWAGT